MQSAECRVQSAVGVFPADAEQRAQRGLAVCSLSGAGCAAARGVTDGAFGWSAASRVPRCSSSRATSLASVTRRPSADSLAAVTSRLRALACSATQHTLHSRFCILDSVWNMGYKPARTQTWIHFKQRHLCDACAVSLVNLLEFQLQIWKVFGF